MPAQAVAADVGDRGIDVDRAVFVARAFVHRHDDVVARLFFIEPSVGREHTEIGVPVSGVEAAEQFFVRREFLVAVDVAFCEPAQEIGLAGLKHAAQARVGVCGVAHELDAGDAGPGALDNLKLDVDATVVQCLLVDGHLRAGATCVPIVALDAFHVALQANVAEHAARLRFGQRLELLGLYLLVAFETYRVNDRVLGNAHDKRIAAAIDLHVRKEPGVIERLDGVVDVPGSEGFAGTDRHVVADGFGVDPGVALDDDGAHHVGKGSRTAEPCQPRRDEG